MAIFNKVKYNLNKNEYHMTVFNARYVTIK